MDEGTSVNRDNQIFDDNKQQYISVETNEPSKFIEKCSDEILGSDSKNPANGIDCDCLKTPPRNDNEKTSEFINQKNVLSDCGVFCLEDGKIRESSKADCLSFNDIDRDNDIDLDKECSNNSLNEKYNSVISSGTEQTSSAKKSGSEKTNDMLTEYNSPSSQKREETLDNIVDISNKSQESMQKNEDTLERVENHIHDILKFCVEENLSVSKNLLQENEAANNVTEISDKQTHENEVEMKIKSSVTNFSKSCKAGNSEEYHLDLSNEDGDISTKMKDSITQINLSDVEKEGHDFFRNDCIQESSSSYCSASTSCVSGEQDEESLNKSEETVIEMVDTELVNCNEIELIELNELELQKDKDIDRIGSEVAENNSKFDEKNEKKPNKSKECLHKEKCDLDVLQDDSKIQKTSSCEEAIHQPGNCEEETITGDTSSQTNTPYSSNENDEVVCIIPDDILSDVTTLTEKNISNFKVDNTEKSSRKTISEKLKAKCDKKKFVNMENAKARPIRNAAKLAGNKIKSLVLNDMISEDQLSEGNIKKRVISTNNEQLHRMCSQCNEVKLWKFLMVQGDKNQYLCSEQCSELFLKNCQNEGDTSRKEESTEFLRKCAECFTAITTNDKCLFWEIMDFCNEDCLQIYQSKLGSKCANCKGNVAFSSLGKYCVRFGHDVKQFCSASCLEEYKKGLKVCSYCQKDISTGTEGFLAPVGDKGQFKDFCTQSCMEKYERMNNNTPLPEVVEECAVCSNSKPVQLEVELDNKTHKLCSEPCFAAFKFVNNIVEGQCDMCRKYFDRAKTGNFSTFCDETLRSFCCKSCMNIYILAHRKIVPCSWCKVKKYNFDMIKKRNPSGHLSNLCSLTCLNCYQVSLNSVSSRCTKCDFCASVVQPQYHLTMSDGTIRNFCSYACVASFENRFSKQPLDLIPGSEQLNSPVPQGAPRRVSAWRPSIESPCVPVISSVQSLASSDDPTSPSGNFPIPRPDLNLITQVNSISQSVQMPTNIASIPAPAPPQIYQQVITKPAPVKQMKNKSILCKPYSHTKGVSCRPHPCMKETQTDQSLNRKFLIPVPIPIYVPAPMHMFATPFPVPVPFPLPIPVPLFIPTTRNSAKGIFKEIKRIQEKIPTDPFEAELLMMAEIVAGEKKHEPTDSESEDGNDGEDGGDRTFSPENVDSSNTFGDDVLQMALKMASELEEPAVDMESVLTSNTITTSTQPQVDPNKALYASDNSDQVHSISLNRGRKRSVRGSRSSTGGTPNKRGRRTSASVEMTMIPTTEPVPPPRIEVEKPDANMCLKYTFGVNAWRHWVMQKNAELEKVAMTNRKIKLFKPELLQLTADELNFSLCLFVKEVRKPNGTEYAPDTIYYLCLGIQQYLFENGRIDNIFTDSYYEKFTDCLDEVAKKFAALYSDSQFIITRVEEEHLWESKQLGAHSPHVLLSTLMFFNTKHFNLVTVEEHMQLSFSHIMKHWKRNPNTPGATKVPGSRNVLLRFYPPQSALEANARKKKVYEQQENEENPLRCPVKLYEFYLSKCPESVKTRNDVFYLLPERSCVPDSPVWYSTMALGKEPLMKMLHRVKMVKEINIALLTC